MKRLHFNPRFETTGAPERRQAGFGKSVDAAMPSRDNRIVLSRFFREAQFLWIGKLLMPTALRRGSSISVIAVVVLGVSLFFAMRPRTFASQDKPDTNRTKHPNVNEAARRNSTGVAYMNQQRFADGQKQFELALAADPGYALARLNLGISFHAQQKSDLAVSTLVEVTKKRPNDPYAWYNLGLTYKDLNEAQRAIEAFQHVAQLKPDEPDAYYFVGYLQTQLQNYDEAIAAFQQALKVFPYHASAEFGLARAYQRKGSSDSARTALQKFQAITSQHLGTPFGAGYGDQGKFSLAEYSTNGVLRAPAATPVHFAQEPIASILQSTGGHLTAPGSSTGACFFDYDGDGKPDLFLVNAMGTGTSRLLHNAGNGRFDDATHTAGLDIPGSGFGCAAGDYDNDGKTDLAVCYADGVRLFRNQGDGKFVDVTQATGIRREKGCVGLTFVDYDHDGDLDLYITMDGAGSSHNILWRNNSNGTFSDVSAETALGAEATGAGLVTTDFNNDRAIDFVLAGGAMGASILLNPREGKFTPLPGEDFPSEHLPPAVGVVAFDFDKDGWMDLAFTHSGPPGISLWRNVEGKSLERVPLPDFGWLRGWGIAAVDFDNDGWLDLVAVGESAKGGEVRLLRNLGAGQWSDATQAAHLDNVKLSQPRAVAVADVSGDGGADLLVTQIGGSPVLLHNEGAAKNNWIQIDLKALNDNKSAIGTKLESRWASLSEMGTARRFRLSGTERRSNPCGSRRRDDR